eukprot:TRINITY_DN1067_c0_g1_i1.p1 TRINITY_DN1067_c0_g1~~TRINITY_DN1067_c0_g1_i1.p1  ORF type:complete len:703 (-),score=160.59 TRINITY_DN1067_c0_g1_i1:65-2173(-)
MEEDQSSKGEPSDLHRSAELEDNGDIENVDSDSDDISDVQNEGDEIPAPPLPPPVFLPSQTFNVPPHPPPPPTLPLAVAAPPPVPPVPAYAYGPTPAAVRVDPMEALAARLRDRSRQQRDTHLGALRDMAHKLRSARSPTLAECKALLKEAEPLENILTKVSDEALSAIGWPDYICGTLRAIVAELDACAVVLAEGRKCVELKTITREAMQSVLTALEGLKNRMDVNLVQQASMQGALLPRDDIQRIEVESEQLQQVLLRRYFKLVFDQCARIPQARTKFDLQYLVPQCLKLLANVLQHAHRLRFRADFQAECTEATALADRLRHDYAHVLDPAAALSSSGGLAASPAAPPPESVASALHACVRSNDMKKLEQLLAAYKASDALQSVVDVEEARSRLTPLAIAVEKGNLVAANQLLAAGAAPGWVMAGGQRNCLLHLAVLAGSLGCLSALLEASPPAVLSQTINAVNFGGETPLHMACRLLNFNAIKALIRAGADLSSKNTLGNLPFVALESKCFPKSAAPPALPPPLIQCPRYLLSRTLSDVELLVDGEVFPAHRLVLCMHSEVLRTLLEGGGGWKESSQNQIVLNDLPAPLFRLLLQYCYTGEVEITKGDATIGLEILAVAQRFLMTGMKERLERLLIPKIQLETVFQLFCGAVDNACPLLKTACCLFIVQHYAEIAFADTDFGILFSVLDAITPPRSAF